MANQEILRGGGKRNYHILRMCVKLHIERAQRSKKFRIQSKITERVAITKERDKIPSPSRRQESAFSGRQIGLVQKGIVVVFYIRVPRETERHQRKK